MVEREFLAHIPIFSSLNEEGLTLLESLLQPVVKEPGEIIFKRGDPPDRMYIILSGKVAITSWTADNEELFLAMMCEGDFLGELALFDEARRSTTAKVFERAELLGMERKDFLDFLRANPEVCLAMMNIIANRIRTTNLLMEHQTTRNVNEEIEHSLTLGDRIAAKVAAIVGSWAFLLSFFSVIVLWVLLNTYIAIWPRPDPYPFTLLNLLLSTLVALQTPIILMNQRRQAEKDRLRAELDYQLSLKAEMQINSLHTKVDEILMHDLRELRSLFRQHLEAEKLRDKSLHRLPT